MSTSVTRAVDCLDMHMDVNIDLAMKELTQFYRTNGANYGLSGLSHYWSSVVIFSTQNSNHIWIARLFDVTHQRERDVN